MKRQILAAWTGKLAVAVLLAITFLPAQAGSPIQTVTNANDSGAGSLRAAINAANGNGTGGAIITFAIGNACGPSIIHLLSPLPDLQQETHILGYNQPGASPNTSTYADESNAVICLILDGATNSVSDAFTVPASVADSVKTEIRGIAFSGFSHAAVNLRGGSQHVIGGIRTGGSVGGFALEPNGYGVILGPGVFASNVGDTDAASLNLLGDLTNNAVYVASSTASSIAAHGNTITNNIIGFYVSDDGNTVTPLPNAGSGMAIGGYNNTITRNFLGYSGAAGIHLSNTDSHGNQVTFNNFEVNQTDGVLVDDDAHDNFFANNVSIDNMGAGFRIVNGLHNQISANDTRTNQGLGIDLAAVGVTFNDNDSMPPAQDYANRGQNFPVITAAAGGHKSGSVTATLTTTPGTYSIEFFASKVCNASGYGEGDEFLYHQGVTGQVTVPNLTSQGQGSISFTIPVQGFFTAGFTNITATATDSDGDTSEFSACFPYTDDTIFLGDFEP